MTRPADVTRHRRMDGPVQFLKAENKILRKRTGGEIRNLGIRGISRRTVRNILKEEGIVPAPDRTSDKRTNFLDRHKYTL